MVNYSHLGAGRYAIHNLRISVRFVATLVTDTADLGSAGHHENETVWTISI